MSSTICRRGRSQISPTRVTPAVRSKFTHLMSARKSSARSWEGDAHGGAISSVLAMLEAARHHGVGKVVVALPAGHLYGEVPARELPVKEGRAFEPSGVAGVLARAVTDLLAVYRDEHALEYTALAMASVYGPRQRQGDGVVAAFVAAHLRGDQMVIYGDGRQTRDLLYVDDATDALLRAGQRGGGLLINIGTGIQTSVRDLAGQINPTESPRHLARRHGDLTRVAVSPTRARIHLQWSPWTSLAEGLAATIAYGTAADQL
jgi:UDP-glucose 4-epimerase